MWPKLVLRAILTCAAVILVSIFSCSKVPMVCTVSPIDIEEFKSDIRDLDAQLADTQERLAQEEARLAKKQAKLSELEVQPVLLTQELYRLKKMSGKVFEEDEDLGANTTARGAR